MLHAAGSLVQAPWCSMGLACDFLCLCLLSPMLPALIECLQMWCWALALSALRHTPKPMAAQHDWTGTEEMHLAWVLIREASWRSYHLSYKSEKMSKNKVLEKTFQAEATAGRRRVDARNKEGGQVSEG